MAYHSYRLQGGCLILKEVLLLVLLVRLTEHSDSGHVRKQAGWYQPVYRHGNVRQPVDLVKKGG